MFARIAVLFLCVAGVSTPALAANQPPVISGTPASWVYVGSQYSFRPTARDADGQTLRFAVFNKPSWASFSTSTGRLYGTPATVGLWTNVRIEVSDGVATRALTSFSIRASKLVNAAPVLSGSPKSAVVVGSSYLFQPSARDADGDPLRFSIVNRPAWAAFNIVTGQLSGTPTATNVGTYSNIVISVSDGKSRATLAPFAVTVVAASRSGVAELVWEPPTENTDGSPLTNLAGYRIVYGSSAQRLTQTIQLTNAGLSAYVVENLAPGTYYFAIRAYASNGAESSDSNVVARVVQ